MHDQDGRCRLMLARRCGWSDGWMSSSARGPCGTELCLVLGLGRQKGCKGSSAGRGSGSGCSGARVGSAKVLSRVGSAGEGCPKGRSRYYLNARASYHSSLGPHSLSSSRRRVRFRSPLLVSVGADAGRLMSLLLSASPFNNKGKRGGACVVVCSAMTVQRSDGGACGDVVDGGAEVR